MTASALALVLVAAVLHATCNFLAKRPGGGAGAVWLYSTLSMVCYAPVAAALVWFRRPGLTAAGTGFMLGSAVLHAGYFISPQRGYRAGDLSVVYPLARGSGPLCSRRWPRSRSSVNGRGKAPHRDADRRRSDHSHLSRVSRDLRA